MKKLILTILFCGFLLPAEAQRFAYVDTDYILENLPEYVQAQNTLKTRTQQWNAEIENRQEILNQRMANFLNEKVLLTEEQIIKEQEDMEFEQKEIKELQEKRYGQGGDLIKLRMALVKPIQDQVYIAVDEVARKKNYAFVFDKGSDLIMIYTDPKFDISRDVLLELNPNAVIKDPPQPNPRGRANTGSSNRSQNTTPAKGANTGKKANTSNQSRQFGTGNQNDSRKR
jgi:outer membrane protein